MRWRESMAPLADRRFRFFFASRAVNLWGTTMAPVALAFAVLEVEDSAAALGQVLAARSIPMVVFLLLGGVLADRVGRRLVIQVANAVSFASQAVAAVLVVTGHAELWHLIVVEAVNGTAASSAYPAMQGMIPQLVPRSQLQPANALLSMVRGALLTIGPTTAGLLVVAVGPGWALALDAGAWLVALLLLVPVKVPPRDAEPASSVLQDLRDGWSVFSGTTWLWVVVLAFGALNAIIAGAWQTLGPPVAKDTIGITGWGYVLSAQAVGVLAASVLMLRASVQHPLRVGMLGCLFFAAPLLMLGLEPSLLPLIVGMFLAGAGFEVFNVGWSVAAQEKIPEHLLSRVYSYDALGSFVAVPLGQLTIGPLGEWFGTRPVLVVSAVAYTAIVLATLLPRSVRDMEREPQEQPRPATASAA